MTAKRKTAFRIAGLILLILLIDQLVKVWVKTSFRLGDGVYFTDWFQLLFVENNGMAFGWQFGDKLLLSIFRLVCCVLLVWYIVRMIRRPKGERTSYIYVIGTTLAGAVGNLIDGTLYGCIFSSSLGRIASFVPFGSGYSSLFHGKVVDMFYFPIITNDAGETLFFDAVFNVADIAVTVSIFLIILFFRKDLNLSLESEKERRERLNKESLKADETVSPSGNAAQPTE
ncbi:MAG: signal peptidase II [Paludibacteraceae bacterium]|nr:signal peptidase II [Paludibacteraceae bacterium]